MGRRPPIRQSNVGENILLAILFGCVVTVIGAGLVGAGTLVYMGIADIFFGANYIP